MVRSCLRVYGQSLSPKNCTSRSVWALKGEPLRSHRIARFSKRTVTSLSEFRIPHMTLSAAAWPCGTAALHSTLALTGPWLNPTPQVIFVELMCTDQALIRSNIMRKVHAQFGEVRSPGETTPIAVGRAEGGESGRGSRLSEMNVTQTILSWHTPYEGSVVSCWVLNTIATHRSIYSAWQWCVDVCRG
jgi:hypothetical protein